MSLSHGTKKSLSTEPGLTCQKYVANPIFYMVWLSDVLMLLHFCRYRHSALDPVALTISLKIRYIRHLASAVSLDILSTTFLKVLI